MNPPPACTIGVRGQGRRVRLAVPSDSVADRQQYSVDAEESSPRVPLAERPTLPAAHHLRRRRSAVVGLSPNSSLSIGAVM